MSAFLRYIANCAIEDRTAESTEQLIGIRVFGRAPGYNTSEDTVVRTTARQLRQRLALYYQEEGAHDPLRIYVPRGAYVPSFQDMALQTPADDAQTSRPMAAPRFEELAAPPSQEDVVIPASADIHAPAPSSWKKMGGLLLLGAVMALLMQWCMATLQQRSYQTAPLWRQLFDSRHRTIFVPGDAGLNMYNNEARLPQPLSLNEYIQGRFGTASANTPASFREQHIVGAPLANRRYTTVSDLDLEERLTRAPYYRADQFSVAYPRGLSVESFRNRNVVLAGAPVYNPWVALFDSNLNFHFVYDNTNGSNRLYVVNRKPRAGEPSQYNFNGDEGFGYIALTDNPNEGGKVLLIEGTAHPGVDASIAFLFDDSRMGAVVTKALRSHGGSGNFEILLRSHFVGANGTDTTIVSSRFY
ncbi:MAG: hypothetical protein PW789_12620 [Edaphobacter sp.]|uniref:hypothetical protein n=1 Tax=Edaphobacter sp. TaxID=1934404 RepID=UPI00238F38E2|nr:hypothetical protein [Edaphobacter sp.]MDE1177428.1 hypothetical protein [Edaphobacter sp.]